MALSRSSLALTFIVTVLFLSVRHNAQTIRAAAPAQIPTVTIEGRVVADDTGVPLPNARVSPSFAAADLQVISTLTDGEGHFTLSFRQGRYNVSASKTGFARRDVPQPAAGQPIEIRLPPGGVISGRVIDEFGDPVADVPVTLETPPNGGRDSRSFQSTTTDDLGDYRLGGLPEGVFLPVVTRFAMVRVGTNQFTNSLEKLYYPGARTAETAQPVSLRAGEQRDGIDFLLTSLQASDQPFSLRNFARTLPTDWSAPRPGTGAIRGRITTADRRGVPQADVMLVPPPNPTDRQSRPRVIRSSYDGRYEFPELGPGRFRVFVSKAGYLPVTDGLFGGTPNSPSIDLPAGEIRDGVDVALTRFGTMTGRVLDEFGFPMMRARVQALHVRYEGGRRKLVAVNIPDRFTDDRGAYRLYGLPPGQYIVSAFIGDVSSEDVPGYARTYFPGMASASDAQFVAMGAGQDVVGLDIPLARTRTARITGRLINASGQPGGGSLTLIPTWRASAAPAEPIGARILPADGRFEFRNVPPGEYVIQSSRGRLNRWTESEFAAVPVVVNGIDVNDLVVQTSGGSFVGGRISFNTLDRTKIPPLSAIEITAVPVDPDLSPSSGWASANVFGDWQFQMNGLSGPRRLVVSGLPAGWTLEEIRAAGTDATDRPLAFGRADQSLTGVEIILSDRVSQLSGTVNDESNRPVRGAHVIVFATDRDRWFPGSRFVRDAMTDDQGTYSVSGLPFGSYYVTTVSQVSAEGPEAWQDPAFLAAQISRTSSLTISEGQRLTRSIRVSSR
jgi:hypothetical protein